LSDVFLTVRLGLWVLKRKTIEVTGPAQDIHQENKL
jgi:hypothetical protein